MVIKRIVLVIGFIGFFVVSGLSQPLSRYDFRIKNFPKTWFASVGGGANIYYGDEDMNVFPLYRTAPAIDVSVGKWMNPLWSLRMQFSGISAKGYSNGPGPFTDDEMDYRTFYTEHFNYMNVHVDGVFNLLTLTNGYAENRGYEILPYVGLGYAWAGNENTSNTSPSLTLGIINKFAVSKVFTIDVELKGAIVGDKLDNVVKENGPGGEGVLTATIGVTYKFIAGGWGRSLYSPKVSR